MLPRVDVGNKGAAVCRRIEKRVWRDNADRILKRGQDVKGEPEFIGRMPLGHRHAYRGDETGALAIGDQLIDFFGRRPLCLALRKWYAPGCQTGHCGAAFQESPAIRFFGNHGSLLKSVFLAFRWLKVYTHPNTAISRSVVAK